MDQFETMHEKYDDLDYKIHDIKLKRKSVNEIYDL